GGVEGALVALRRVGGGDGAWVHAQTRLAEIAIRRRRLAEAEGILRGAVGRDRRAVAPLRKLVYILVLERRTAEARSMLRLLYEATRDPRQLAGFILVSHSEADVRDLGPEIETFLLQDPDDPWLRRAWGLFLATRGRSAEALPHLEAAAGAFEDDPVGRFALAECRLALGRSQGEI